MVLKLNLGCGRVYKPGYVNIDSSDSAIADEVCDVLDLPFDDNAVEAIEAIQLLEHFDHIQVKYVLAEMFRVLEPNATLIIETPDLEKSMKKLTRAKEAEQTTTLQWLYGIDSPGMQHKTGFTFPILKSLLEEAGFTEISQKKQRTHLYEPGLRVECQKLEKSPLHQFMSSFRKHLRHTLKTDDSNILIPLEEHVQEMMPAFSQSESLNAVLARAAVRNPALSLAFLNTLRQHSTDTHRAEDDILKHLVEQDFHKHVFSLWMKSKKKSSSLQEEFNAFITRLEATLFDVLEGKQAEDRLDYVLTTTPRDILLFDLRLLSLESQRTFSLGVKQFLREEHKQALSSFEEAALMRPDNPLTYWNLARIHAALDSSPDAAENYAQALSLIKDKRIRKFISAEQEAPNIPKKPVTDDIFS